MPEEREIENFEPNEANEIEGSGMERHGMAYHFERWLYQRLCWPFSWKTAKMLTVNEMEWAAQRGKWCKWAKNPYTWLISRWPAFLYLKIAYAIYMAVRHGQWAWAWTSNHTCSCLLSSILTTHSLTHPHFSLSVGWFHFVFVAKTETAMCLG